MLNQIVSQFEQMCLKLRLKNNYTLAVSNGPERAKARSPKVLNLVLGNVDGGQ